MASNQTDLRATIEIGWLVVCGDNLCQYLQGAALSDGWCGFGGWRGLSILGSGEIINFVVTAPHVVVAHVISIMKQSLLNLLLEERFSIY